MPDGERTHPLHIAPHVLDILDVLAPRGHFEHVAVYSGVNGGPGIGRNGNVEALCEGMVEHMMDSPRPFVSVTFYGSFQYHGPRIWFNRAASPIAAQIARADERLYMTRQQARSRMGLEGRCNGDYVVRRRYCRTINSQSGNTSVHRPEGGPVMVQFPRSGYRIKQMLDLLSEATRLAGINRDELFVTTVGGQMMNVGVNVRDSSHGMRLTAMTAVMSEGNNSRINYEFLRQMLGRLAGISRPAIHAQYCLSHQRWTRCTGVLPGKGAGAVGSESSTTNGSNRLDTRGILGLGTDQSRNIIPRRVFQVCRLLSPTRRPACNNSTPRGLQATHLVYFEGIAYHNLFREILP